MSQMYMYHYKLEMLLYQVDQNNDGIITINDLEQVLTSNQFNFPENAIDTVLSEMLGLSAN